MLGFLIGLLAGHGLYGAGLPDGVRQERYDRAQARRKARRVARRSRPRLTATQQLYLLLALILFFAIVH